MAISTNPSIPSKITYQNIQNNQSIKLTLYKRISKIFSRLYEKISNLFSRKPSQMRALKEIEPIYDVPQNNRPVKKLTLYERISNLFSGGSNRLELLEKRVNGENAQLQQRCQELHHYICISITRINYLNNFVHNLKSMVDAKEDQINSLKQTILSLKEELYSNRTQVSRSDSGFSEASYRKKHGFISKIIP
ncbi:MAG: hypothetical protein M3A24_05595 [Candidatus Rhabdochlamydia oedothoracis]|nr:hypothetical protein [Candidatus Rhabdochlamydia oedothoracis]